MSKRPTSHRVRGFTMIEVLVAVVIASVGLLGTGLALIVVQRSDAASLTSQVMAQDMSNLAEAMQANPAGLKAGNYNATLTGTSSTTVPSCAGPSCSPAQVATYDLAKAAKGLQSVPGATIRVAATTLPSGYVSVSLSGSWKDGPATSASVAAPAHSLSVQNVF